MKMVLFGSKMFDFTTSLERELCQQNALNCGQSRAGFLEPNIPPAGQ